MLAAVMTTSCVSYSCSNVVEGGKKIVENRNLSGFEEIEISGSPTVYYAQADSFSVSVEGKESAVERIITEVHNGTLYIRNRSKVGPVNVVIVTGSSPVVRVSSPDLVGVRLNGSGDFISEGRIDTDRMNVMLRGSGDIRIKDIICDRSRVDLVGSGDIEIKRLETQASTIELVGSGDIDISQHNVAKTDIALRGSGDVNVDFADGCVTADVELRGSGDIDLSGHLKHYTMDKRGSGDVDANNLSVEK